MGRFRVEVVSRKFGQRDRHDYERTAAYYIEGADPGVARSLAEKMFREDFPLDARTGPVVKDVRELK